MATLHFHAKTNATPEQFLAALTDFGPGRSELFGNSADEYLKVHDQGPDWADVTEGSGGVWERLRYDWADPRRIVMTTTDSNLWGGASGHTYTLMTLPEGNTIVDAVVVREGKNPKGRLLGLVLGTVGKSKLRKADDRHGPGRRPKPAPKLRARRKARTWRAFLVRSVSQLGPQHPQLGFEFALHLDEHVLGHGVERAEQRSALPDPERDVPEL